jgi:hypothetical protein
VREVVEVSMGTVTMALCEGLVYPLTQCCAASGKGGADGVVCRYCYRRVDGVYGMCASDWAEVPYMLEALVDSLPRAEREVVSVGGLLDRLHIASESMVSSDTEVPDE